MKCANPDCGKQFRPRGVKRFCSTSCRKAAWRTGRPERDREIELRHESAIEIRERVLGLLAHLYAEERAEAAFQLRYVQKRSCQCNGHGVRDYDEDGDAICRGCGKPIRGERRDRSRGVNQEIDCMMRRPREIGDLEEEIA